MGVSQITDALGARADSLGSQQRGIKSDMIMVVLVIAMIMLVMMIVMMMMM